MRLITLNIWGGRVVFKLPEFFRKEDADIICLQEVNDLAGETGGVFESLDMLQQKAGFTEKFMASNLTFRYQNRETEYGNAMLSKLPLNDRELVFVQGEHYRDYDDHEIDHDHPRNFQHATVELHGKQVHIINFHGAFIHGTKDGTEDTLRHVQHIADYAEQFADDPIIITGDFNVVPESKSMQILGRRFRNMPVEHGVDSTYSSVLHSFTLVCDYIFVNEHVTVNAFNVPEDIVSDHRPLVMEFDV